VSSKRAVWRRALGFGLAGGLLGCVAAPCPAQTVELAGGACVFFDSDGEETAYCFEDPQNDDDALQRANAVPYEVDTPEAVYQTALGGPRDIDYFEVEVPGGCEATVAVQAEGPLVLEVATARAVVASPSASGGVVGEADPGADGRLTVRVVTADADETGCIVYAFLVDWDCP